MTINTISCLNQVASFLKVPPGKINLDANFIPVRIANNATTTGFISIIFELLKQANCSLRVNSIEDKADLRQWLEYAIVYAIRAVDGSQNISQVLKELNGILSSRTYLVGYNLSIADVVMFYILHHAMINLSYLEKEKYLNVSRWFDNVQQDASVRQKNKVIEFSTNYLTAVAPARH